VIISSNDGFGLLSDPDAFLKRAALLPIFSIFPADSNGIGQAIGDATSGNGCDPVFPVMTTLPSIPYFQRFAQAASDPINWLTNVTVLGPYAPAGQVNTGLQWTFGYEMIRAGYACGLVMANAVNGSGAFQWTPGASYPTSPGGGPNVWTQSVTTNHAQEAAMGGRIRGQIMDMGGNDGFNGTNASNCAANLTTSVNATLAEYGAGTKIIMLRSPDEQAPAVTFLTTIQAAQDSVAAAFPLNITLINTSGFRLASDNLHWVGDSVNVIGQLCAYAMLDAMGVPRARPTTIPTIMGWGPLYTGAAAYNFNGPGCSIAGDLEILFAISQDPSGGLAGNDPITTPTTAGTKQWIPKGTQLVSTNGTTSARVAIFVREVSSGDLTAFGNKTAPSTMPITTPTTNPINGARICVVRGPSALTHNNVDAILTSKNDAFSTALTLAQITTSVANCLVIPFAGGYRTNLSVNSVTMAPAGSLVNGINRYGSTRAVATDMITNAAWQYDKVAAGATGAVNVTFGINTIGVGALVAISSMASVTRDSASGIYCPANAAEWAIVMATAGIASGGPSLLWGCQEASGNLADSIGTFTGTVSGTPVTYQQAVAGWTRKGIAGSDAGTGLVTNSDAGLPDPATASTLTIGYVILNSIPAALRVYGTIIGSGVPTYDAVLNTGRLQAVSSSSVSGAVSSVGAVRPIGFIYDVTNNRVAGWSDQEILAPIKGATTGKIFQDRLGFPGAILYRVAFFGAAAELTNAQIKTLLQTLGWTIPW